MALVLDKGGVVQDVAFGSSELSAEGYDKWRGRPWVDTVTIESREKVEEMLGEAGDEVQRRPRQVNHPSKRGNDVPVLYKVIRVGRQQLPVALGRDLRDMASLQQRLVEAQQAMEREYGKLRHAETRYRLLFQISSEAVLIVDASSRKIVEANPAAGQLLGQSEKQLVGRAVTSGLDRRSAAAIDDLLSRAGAAGSAGDVQIRQAKGEAEFMASTSLFRHENGAFYLVRLKPLQWNGTAHSVPQSRSTLLKVIETGSDGLVVTDSQGLILSANRAFLDLVQVTSEAQAEGQSLDRWMGRPGVDLSVLLSNLREHSAVRLFATSLRGEHGSVADVEISAVSVPDEDQPRLGFMIRNVTRRLTGGFRANQELPRSVEQLTELVGRVSMKDIVRETTDVIERLCIEAALELTGDNRASAAEMLGLSRQSLYVKLRRHGLADLASEGED